MSSSQALIPVIAAPNALPVASYGDRVIQNGPGMHLNLMFTAGGKHVEKVLTKLANVFGWGPVTATQAIESFFGDGAARLERLDKLYLLRQPSSTSSAGLKPDLRHRRLGVLCGEVLKYTKGTQYPDTQLLAFKGIVRLTTRYVGLRELFMKHLSTRDKPRPSKSDIVQLWKKDSLGGDKEWGFFLEYAAYCMAGPDEVTSIVETLKPSCFGTFTAGLCISDRLSNWISNTLAATELSRLAAVRHLAGILELPSFWKHRIENDPHSLPDVLCKLGMRLLEDLATDCEKRELVSMSDIITLDPEGINELLQATLYHLPPHSPQDDETRSTSSHEIAGRLAIRLQRQVPANISLITDHSSQCSERSLALFPEAAEYAKKFLETPGTDANKEEEPEIVDIPTTQLNEEEPETIDTPTTQLKEEEPETVNITAWFKKRVPKTFNIPTLQFNYPTRWNSSSSSHVQDPRYKLFARDRIIVVMGPTGAGKSTFIEYATQQSGASVGYDLQSRTSEIRAVRAKHPRDHGSVIFVDTPGFDDTNRSDIEILAQISGWFVKAYREKVPISAIVYLHRISDNRMAGSPLKNLQMFASMCGYGAMPRVVLATTMWGELTRPATGEQREKELKGTFWANMIKQGSTVQRFGDSYQSAWQTVGKLPMGEDNIILSREIYDDKKNLKETAAGVELTKQLNMLVADQKEAARRLEEQVNSQHNPVLVAELQQRQAEIEKKIGGTTAQLQQLKIPLGRNVTNFITGKTPRKSGVYVPGNR